MSGATLDAGALIGIDRNDRRVLMILERSRALDARVTIPATALAQAIRDPQRQARLMRLIRLDITDVVPLDDADARAVGRLLSTSGTSDTTDAHVVLCAKRAGQPVVTSDPRDLAVLDAKLDIVRI